MGDTQRIRGVGIGRQIALGPLLRMAEPLPAPADVPSARSQAEEIARADEALAAVARLLSERGALAGGSAKDVLDAQALMAQDPSVTASVHDLLANGKTAESAVFQAFSGFKDMLLSLGGYMAERAVDLDDVAARVLAHLRGVPAPGVPESDTPFVLVARDLAPADTALLDLEKVLAVVTSEGGPTAHTAILAREKGIVAVVGAVGATDLPDGTVLIVDAASGEVVVQPDDAEQQRALVEQQKRRDAANRPQTPGALADGTPVPLLANLGSAGGVQKALAAGAEGVGLFRTEFLFLDSLEAPTVAQQVAHYTEVLAAFAGKKVVVRLLDAGADKPLAFLGSAAEENPALGLRGLRALNANEGILRDQLTALAEADAATDAELWVMAPMVSTVAEAAAFCALAHELGLRTAGVMIEVPSAALMAETMAAHSDFFSIGTNDLTQYTMAADRMLGSVAALQDPWHPAVLRLIGGVGAAGEAQSTPVGICGEAAADPLLAVVLVGLGATSLSMSASAIADVRAELSCHTKAEAVALAQIALRADSAESVRAAVRAAVSQKEATS